MSLVASHEVLQLLDLLDGARSGQVFDFEVVPRLVFVLEKQHLGLLVLVSVGVLLVGVVHPVDRRHGSGDHGLGHCRGSGCKTT